MDISVSRESAMSRIHDGWHGMVNEFYDAMDEWNLEHPQNKVIITDIKQKWGDLRISFFPQVEKLSNLYREIKKKSNTICEICGEPGKHTDKYYNDEYWMYILCGKHKKMHPIDYFERANY